jgi:hypothetical protein
VLVISHFVQSCLTGDVVILGGLSLGAHCIVILPRSLLVSFLVAFQRLCKTCLHKNCIGEALIPGVFDSTSKFYQGRI